MRGPQFSRREFTRREVGDVKEKGIHNNWRCECDQTNESVTLDNSTIEVLAPEVFVVGETSRQKVRVWGGVG